MCSCIVECLLKQTYVLTRDKVRNMWEDRTHKVFHPGGRSGCLTRTGRGEEEYPLLQKKGKDLGQWLLEAMVQFLSMLLWLVTHVPVPQGCQYTGLSVACVEHFSVSLLIFYMTTLPFFWLTLYCAGSKFGHSLFSRILLRRIWSRSTLSLYSAERFPSTCSFCFAHASLSRRSCCQRASLILSVGMVTLVSFSLI